MSDFSVSAKLPTITQLLLPKSVTGLNDPNHPDLIKNEIYMSYVNKKSLKIIIKTKIRANIKRNQSEQKEREADLVLETGQLAWSSHIIVVIYAVKIFIV